MTAMMKVKNDMHVDVKCDSTCMCIMYISKFTSIVNHLHATHFTLFSDKKSNKHVSV